MNNDSKQVFMQFIESTIGNILVDTTSFKKTCNHKINDECCLVLNNLNYITCASLKHDELFNLSEQIFKTNVDLRSISQSILIALISFHFTKFQSRLEFCCFVLEKLDFICVKDDEKLIFHF